MALMSYNAKIGELHNKIVVETITSCLESKVKIGRMLIRKIERIKNVEYVYAFDRFSTEVSAPYINAEKNCAILIDGNDKNILKTKKSLLKMVGGLELN